SLGLQQQIDQQSRQNQYDDASKDPQLGPPATPARMVADLVDRIDVWRWLRVLPFTVRAIQCIKEQRHGGNSLSAREEALDWRSSRVTRALSMPSTSLSRRNVWAPTIPSGLMP